MDRRPRAEHARIVLRATYHWLLGRRPRAPHLGDTARRPPPFGGIHTNRTPVPERSGGGAPILDAGAPPAANRATTGRHTSDTRSTASSDQRGEDRHYGPPQAREDILRHQVQTSRDRHRDAPYWKSRTGGRYGNYSSRSEYSDDTVDRDRDRYRYLQDLEREDNRRPDGHPIASTASHPFNPVPDPDYVNREEERRAAASRPRDDVTARVPPETLGIWRFLQMAVVPQSLNLTEWLARGEETAYLKFLDIARRCSEDPTAFRTEGEAYLMRNQQTLERNWWVYTTGAVHPPRAERIRSSTNQTRTSNSAAGPSRCPQADMEVDDGAPPAPQPTAPPHTPATGTMWSFGTTIVLPAATPGTAAGPSGVNLFPPSAETRAYFGTSPPDPVDVAPPASTHGDFRPWRGLPNSLATEVEIARYYAFLDTHLWMSSLRNMLGTRPRPGGDSVFNPDAQAYQTLIALGPGDRRNNTHQWHLFFETALTMLSIPALYAHIVTIGGYPTASLPLEHYPYATDNITIPLVAAWLVQHGVPTTGPEIGHMESFARSCRNMRVGIVELDNVGWADEPRDIASAFALDHSTIPTWGNLGHGPRRTTAPPTIGGIMQSMHAPAMEVEPTSPALGPESAALAAELPPPPPSPTNDGEEGGEAAE
ncbi:hypothetical protein DFH07DRAFT_778618 [Mycena maculata]|uniref:Uncharacterized protein n=1 Tax=Mycena maculata TaxID=230809 RepID=A0AAD7IC35_9AGAR|nr:hypothetical protein DFH07DRAFT_778618 [Mycena maculata]